MKKILLFSTLILILFSTSVFASDARYLLNSAPLTPTFTGFAPCDNIVQETLAEITNDQMSTYDKVKTCYDYLIETCSYGNDDAMMKYVNVNTIHTIMGPIRASGMLEGHVGACDDYSCAFAALVRAIGLNCYTIGGDTARATGGMTGHIWTVININGIEYVFDPQIDDNIAKGGPIGYYRFCVTYAETPGSYDNYSVHDSYFEPF